MPRAIVVPILFTLVHARLPLLAVVRLPDRLPGMSWLVRLVSLLLMHIFAARAMPLQGFAMLGLEGRNANLYINNGEPPKDRSIFIMVSLVCIMVLSLLLGTSSSYADICVKQLPLGYTMDLTDTQCRFAVHQVKTKHPSQTEPAVNTTAHIIRPGLDVHHLLRCPCSRSRLVYSCNVRCWNVGVLNILHIH
jgi:hypothetical protein